MPFWSKTDGWVIAVLCIITTWKTFGYNFINILAGVSGVSQEVIEAARLDQVPMWKIFLDIIVPMSSATGIYVFITTIVQGLQYVFTPIKVITQGGPNYASSNLIYASYHEAFTLYRTGTSSAISILTMLLFIVLLLLEFKFVYLCLQNLRNFRSQQPEILSGNRYGGTLSMPLVPPDKEQCTFE